MLRVIIITKTIEIIIFLRKIHYMAEIKQDTDEVWTDTKISLSTSQPITNNNLSKCPKLKPKKVDLYSKKAAIPAQDGYNHYQTRKHNR